MSVSVLVEYFLTEIRLIWEYLQFWMRYLFEIFWETFFGCGYNIFKYLKAYKGDITSSRLDPLLSLPSKLLSLELSTNSR